MKTRKLKKSGIALIVCLLAVIVIAAVILINPKSFNNNKEPHGQIIQDEGELQIIVPEEMGDGGF